MKHPLDDRFKSLVEAYNSIKEHMPPEQRSPEAQRFIKSFKRLKKRIKTTYSLLVDFLNAEVYASLLNELDKALEEDRRNRET